MNQTHFNINFGTTLDSRLEIILRAIKQNHPTAKEWKNEHYSKIKLNFHGFFAKYFLIIQRLTVDQDTKMKYIKHFFRIEKCQKEFNKITKAGSNNAADHILAQSILFNYLKHFSNNDDHSYDYLFKFRTVINQCWNFQKLTKSVNSSKATIEKQINVIIKKNGGNFAQCVRDLKEVDKIVSYFRDAQEAIVSKKGNRFTSGNMKPAKMFYNFIEQITGTKENLSKKKACTCEICNIARKDTKTMKVCCWNAIVYVL